MSFEHCHSCLPPVRYLGCQDHCPHYAADKEKSDASRRAKEGKYRAIDDFRVARRFKQKRLQNLK